MPTPGNQTRPGYNIHFSDHWQDSDCEAIEDAICTIEKKGALSQPATSHTWFCQCLDTEQGRRFVATCPHTDEIFDASSAQALADKIRNGCS